MQSINLVICKPLLLVSFFIILQTASVSQTFNIYGPAGSVAFGSSVTVLTNGNYVVTDSLWNTEFGAVYLYNGVTHTLIYKLTGDHTGIKAGSGGVIALSNGHFLVFSPHWQNGSVLNAGAVTWCNGNSGTNAIINSGNSLVGSHADDQVGNGPYLLLSNGNFVISSPDWDNGAVPDAGAVTWGNGNTGSTGTIGSGNSLIGTSNKDFINQNLLELDNGNYVINSPFWDNGAVYGAGAVTWGNGNTGISGTINSTNSLVGSTLNDAIGSGGIFRLNSDYLVFSPFYDNGPNADVGAVTWCNGTTGKTGAIYPGNSLLGLHTDDQVGNGGFLILSNGNYVISSPDWDNGPTMNAGAVTWASGITGINGAVTSANSLVGSRDNDRVGEYMIKLSNGNYVIGSPAWDNGTTVNAGAVTWADGTTGITGAVSTVNSLAGDHTDDHVGQNLFVLENGSTVKYVICSPDWDNVSVVDAGAVFLGDGTSGNTGIIAASNSLVGTKANDQVGGGGIFNLHNGNFVVLSPQWGVNSVTTPNVGAVTFVNGGTGITGAVSTSNSLTGSSANDQVGIGGITLLSNHNYLVKSYLWKNGPATGAGAVTFGNGTTGVSGVVSSSNSLVSNISNSQVGLGEIEPLFNGNYVVNTKTWNNGAGAVTFGNGTTGISGIISSTNSLVGTLSQDNVGIGGVYVLINDNYVVNSYNWKNGAATNAGAVTWGNGTTGIHGVVSSANSLVGSSAGDRIGSTGLYPLISGNYLVLSHKWDDLANSRIDVGAVTWGNGTLGTTGPVSYGNSLIGTQNFDQLGNMGIVSELGNNYTVYSSNWSNGATPNAGAVTFGSGTMPIIRFIEPCSSIEGTLANQGHTFTITDNGIHSFTLVGKPFENTVTVFKPMGHALANHLDIVTQAIAGIGSTPFINDFCRIICTVLPTGSSTAISGSITARAWIESTQPAFFVKRHYEITPASNASTATAKVTLYFTQSEFDAFNAVNTIKLPVNSTDAAGISHLLVEKRAGSSGDGSGLPDTYPGGITTIDPADSDITWNEITGRWEVSFDVTGFSGFFVKTTSSVLPVTLLSFTGSKQANHNVLLQWQTTNEINLSHFDLERSTTGTGFEKIASAAAKNNMTINDYQYTDASPWTSEVRYYRLKMTGIEGKFKYSAIVRIRISQTGSIAVYPNPANDVITIDVGDHKLIKTMARLTAINGQPVKQIRIENKQQLVSIKDLPSGIYMVRFEDGSTVKLMKQ